MAPGLLLFATSRSPDGRLVLAIGLVFLAASVAELVVSSRRPHARPQASAWAGRLFAIAVWLLMIVAGIVDLVGRNRTG